MTKPMLIASCCVVTMAGAPACATKTFVRTEVGTVNDKVATLGRSLEDTQARVRAAEQRIGETDARAQAAVQSAQQADAAARSAQATGSQALDIGRQTAAKADAIDASMRTLVFETVLADDHAKFDFGVARLSDEAKAALDQMVARVKAQKAAIWVEIEGHTDNVGDAGYNQRLGQARAEAVKRYLHEQHQVPLHKMDAISFGEEQPVQDNSTRAHRAQNRRVVVKVLA